jgi:hypothetical protein
MEAKKSAEDRDPLKNSAENPEKPKRSKTDPLNMNRPSLKDHSNPMIRGFAKAGYTVWIIVLAVGLFLAFVVSLFLV